MRLALSLAGFQQMSQRASLFENMATTGPFASPTLTSNLAPSWVTVYVFMVSIFTGFAGYDPIRGIKMM